MAISIKKLRAVMADKGKSTVPVLAKYDGTAQDAETASDVITAWETEGLLAGEGPSFAAKQSAKSTAKLRAIVAASLAKAAGRTAPTLAEQPGWELVEGKPSDVEVIQSHIEKAAEDGRILALERGETWTDEPAECDIGKRGSFIKGRTKAGSPAQRAIREAHNWIATFS